MEACLRHRPIIFCHAAEALLEMVSTAASASKPELISTEISGASAMAAAPGSPTSVPANTATKARCNRRTPTRNKRASTLSIEPHRAAQAFGGRDLAFLIASTAPYNSDHQLNKSLADSLQQFMQTARDEK
eukprot:4781103-Pyramimonas_sp.AAC.1